MRPDSVSLDVVVHEDQTRSAINMSLGALFEPTAFFAGVARSFNFYPTPPLTSADGVAAVALGLGRTVVEGERSIMFCPRYPQHLVQFSSVKDMLANSQRAFWALDLGGDADMRESQFELDVAEADGTLAALASTYSPENDAIYDGISRPGTRLISFASILKRGTDMTKPPK